MSYHVYENTRYDKAAQKSIPYSYTLSWNVYTNSPHGYGQAKIAGQDRKVFADRAAMEKYLNGRIKAYEKLFTEISPVIPPEYAEQFRERKSSSPPPTFPPLHREPNRDRKRNSLQS